MDNPDQDGDFLSTLIRFDHLTEQSETVTEQNETTAILSQGGDAYIQPGTPLSQHEDGTIEQVSVSGGLFHNAKLQPLSSTPSSSRTGSRLFSQEERSRLSRFRQDQQTASPAVVSTPSRRDALLNTITPGARESVDDYHGQFDQLMHTFEMEKTKHRSLGVVEPNALPLLPLADPMPSISTQSTETLQQITHHTTQNYLEPYIFQNYYYLNTHTMDSRHLLGLFQTCLRFHSTPVPRQWKHIQDDLDQLSSQYLIPSVNGQAQFAPIPGLEYPSIELYGLISDALHKRSNKHALVVGSDGENPLLCVASVVSHILYQHTPYLLNAIVVHISGRISTNEEFWIASMCNQISLQLGIDCPIDNSSSFLECSEYIIRVLARVNNLGKAASSPESSEVSHGNPSPNESADPLDSSTAAVVNNASQTSRQSESPASIPLIVVIDQLEKFTQDTSISGTNHSRVNKQSLLYFLSNLGQESTAWVTVIAVSSTPHVSFMLEKRIKSRFPMDIILLKNSVVIPYQLYDQLGQFQLEQHFKRQRQLNQQEKRTKQHDDKKLATATTDTSDHSDDTALTSMIPVFDPFSVDNRKYSLERLQYALYRLLSLPCESIAPRSNDSMKTQAVPQHCRAALDRLVVSPRTWSPIDYRKSFDLPSYTEVYHYNTSIVASLLSPQVVHDILYPILDVGITFQQLLSLAQQIIHITTLFPTCISPATALPFIHSQSARPQLAPCAGADITSSNDGPHNAETETPSQKRKKRPHQSISSMLQSLPLHKSRPRRESGTQGLGMSLVAHDMNANPLPLPSVDSTPVVSSLFSPENQHQSQSSQVVLLPKRHGVASYIIAPWDIFTAYSVVFPYTPFSMTSPLSSPENVTTVDVQSDHIHRIRHEYYAKFAYSPHDIALSTPLTSEIYTTHYQEAIEHFYRYGLSLDDVSLPIPSDLLPPQHSLPASTVVEASIDLGYLPTLIYFFTSGCSHDEFEFYCQTVHTHNQHTIERLYYNLLDLSITHQALRHYFGGLLRHTQYSRHPAPSIHTSQLPSSRKPTLTATCRGLNPDQWQCFLLNPDSSNQNEWSAQVDGNNDRTFTQMLFDRLSQFWTNVSYATPPIHRSKLGAHRLQSNDQDSTTSMLPSLPPVYLFTTYYSTASSRLSSRYLTLFDVVADLSPDALGLESHMTKIHLRKHVRPPVLELLESHLKRYSFYCCDYLYEGFPSNHQQMEPEVGLISHLPQVTSPGELTQHPTPFHYFSDLLFYTTHEEGHEAMDMDDYDGTAAVQSLPSSQSDEQFKMHTQNDGQQLPFHPFSVGLPVSMTTGAANFSNMYSTMVLFSQLIQCNHYELGLIATALQLNYRGRKLFSFDELYKELRTFLTTWSLLQSSDQLIVPSTEYSFTAFKHILFAELFVFVRKYKVPPLDDSHAHTQLLQLDTLTSSDGGAAPEQENNAPLDQASTEPNHRSSKSGENTIIGAHLNSYIATIYAHPRVKVHLSFTLSDFESFIVWYSSLPIAPSAASFPRPITAAKQSEHHQEYEGSLLPLLTSQSSTSASGRFSSDGLNPMSLTRHLQYLRLYQHGSTRLPIPPWLQDLCDQTLKKTVRV